MSLSKRSGGSVATPVSSVQFTRKGPGVHVFISGYQNLIFRMRHSDAWIKQEIHKTNELIGRKLVRDARAFHLPHDRSGIVSRNISYEQKALQHTYRLYFGLTNAKATKGSASVTSRAFAEGAPGTVGEAAHGIWADKGTGIFGLHRRPYPARRAGVRKDGRPVKMLMGQRPRPFLTRSREVNRSWIYERYRLLGHGVKHYIDSGEGTRG